MQSSLESTTSPQMGEMSEVVIGTRVKKDEGDKKLMSAPCTGQNGHHQKVYE